ncbi:MAG: leucine-rich repeat protein, partial [Treponema sp.]|nr:leucine-rich repeat protein [Treponema sp.]
LTRIGSDSFCNCSRLISINIPASVTRIEKDAFKNSNIGTITFENKENWYYMENGYKTYLTESDLAASNFTGLDTLPSIYRIN